MIVLFAKPCCCIHIYETMLYIFIKDMTSRRGGLKSSVAKTCLGCRQDMSWPRPGHFVAAAKTWLRQRHVLAAAGNVLDAAKTCIGFDQHISWLQQIHVLDATKSVYVAAKDNLDCEGCVVWGGGKGG